MEEKKDDAWARFNALLDVAEEERLKYEKESKKPGGEKRSLRRNINLTSEFLLKTGKENSEMNDSRRATQNLNHQKGKRSDRKKKSYADALNKLPQLSDLDEENHGEMDCGKLILSGNVIEKPSKRLNDTSGEEEMPRPKKVKNALMEEPIMAIPEACYFERNYQANDGNVLFSAGAIIKNSSKRLRAESHKGEGKIPKAENTNRNVDFDLPVQPLPENFKNKIRAMGGSESEISFVFQKTLTPTDVHSHYNRLLIPFRQLKDHSFLTDEERELLEKRYSTEGENSDAVYITAFLIDPNCNEGQMNLTRWNMGKGAGKVSRNYSLLTHWRKTVEKNGLKALDVVQVWGFRKGSELGLALVKV